MNDRSPVSALTQIGQVVAYGSSIVAGTAVSDPSRDIMTRLAAMLGAKEYNYAKAGAQLMWTNDLANDQWGVVPTINHTWKRPVRAATTIATVDPAIGATVITTATDPSTGSATGPAFKTDDAVCIGTGANCEIARVESVSATQIFLDDFEGSESYSGLLRDHAIGEPVHVVPTHYGAGNTLFIVYAPGHYYYAPGVYANAQRWHKEAQRLCISRMRAAEIYEPDHTACVFSGSWTATGVPRIAALSGSTGAQSGRAPTAINAAVTLHVPQNFPGGTVSFNLMQLNGNTGGGVWTFTVDGAAWTVNGPNTGTGNTFTQVATPTTPVTKVAWYCARLKGLAAGSHTIVATMSTFEANSFFDNWVIEAEDPPIVMWFLGNRMASYDGFAAAAESGHLRSTLQSQANPGATSVVVNAAALAGGRQFADSTPGPQVPVNGEYMSINPRTSLEENRAVTSVTGDTAPFTIGFSGGLSNTHPVGTRIEIGHGDYVVRNYHNVWTTDVKNEFDDYVLLHNTDYLHPHGTGPEPPSGFPKSDTYYALDAQHFNDKGAAIVAENVYRQLQDERRIDLRMASRLGRPVTVPSSRFSFLDGDTAVAWTNMPAALSEFPLTTTGNGSYRRVADLSRFYEARIGCVQTVIGASTAKLRIQYSIDQGTNWHYLHSLRLAGTQMTATNWAESTASTDTMCQIDLVSALPASGVKYTAFEPLYPEVLQPQYTDLFLRVVGIGGSGAASPALRSIWLECR